MRPVRTLTGTTQISTIKLTWARSKSMKGLHETGTRLQIGMNAYMKHAGSLHFSFVVLCLLMLNAAPLIKTQLKAMKKERVTPSLLHTNIPRFSLTLSYAILLNTIWQDLLRNQGLYLHILSLMLPVLQSNPQQSHPWKSNGFNFLWTLSLLSCHLGMTTLLRMLKTMISDRFQISSCLHGSAVRL